MDEVPMDKFMIMEENVVEYCRSCKKLMVDVAVASKDYEDKLNELAADGLGAEGYIGIPHFHAWQCPRCQKVYAEINTTGLKKAPTNRVDFSSRLLFEQEFNNWRSEVMNDTGIYPSASAMNVAVWLINTVDGKKWAKRLYESVHGSNLKCDRCEYKAGEGLKEMMHCPKCQYGRLRDMS